MSEMKFTIQWTNKYSREIGYVGKVMYKAGHFVNAEAQDGAKKYKSVADAEKDIARLIEIGEAVNNDFSIVEYEA